MHSRIVAIIRKETREVLRDRIYLALAIAVPLIIMIILGLGFILDVKNLPVAFYDQDRSTLSREYMYSFTNSEYFRLTRLINDEAEIDQLIQAGQIRAVVVIPPDFSRNLSAGKPAAVQILADGSFPSRAQIVSGYIAAVNAQFNQQLLSKYLARRGVSANVVPISVEGRVWYNPSLEAKNSTVPGLLVINLMFYPSLLAALVVVREKERGTIFNLYCSPVRRWEIIVGKAVPYIGVALVDYFLLFTLAVTAFGVRFVGNFFVLTLGAALFITCCIGLGLVISVLCKTQVAAMFLTFITLMTPSILFSGILTPIASMDRSAQIISRVIPASYFMSMARGIFLKGLPFSYYFFDFVLLMIYAAVVYVIASLALRKKVG
ncbi:MAG: ABC transporter permease [Acidobacteria bacterium]|nr:ABC transporter permease [Acidobacteriota bacterium]